MLSETTNLLFMVVFGALIGALNMLWYGLFGAARRTRPAAGSPGYQPGAGAGEFRQLSLAGKLILGLYAGTILAFVLAVWLTPLEMRWWPFIIALVVGGMPVMILILHVRARQSAEPTGQDIPDQGSDDAPKNS